MVKRKSKSSSPQHSHYIAIVTIVAVVAILILVMNSMQTQVGEVSMGEFSGVGTDDGQALAGQAALSGTETSTDFESRLQAIMTSGELRVGTTGDWNLMSWIDPMTQERSGFDIDIVTKLAADMGVEIVFVPTTWKTLVNGIIANAYDISTSASLSPKRALVAGYSFPYFYVEDVPLMLDSNNGIYNSWEDLNNPDVTVAVNMGTVQQKRAEVLFDQANIITVSAPARDYQEVLAERADISMTSNLEAAKLVKQYPQLMLVPVKEGRNPTPLAMLLPQDDQVWINYVNNWIILNTERGFFEQLKAEWGIGPSFEPDLLLLNS